MIHDGINFRSDRFLVQIPVQKTDPNPNYLRFGFAVPEGKKPPAHAVKTDYKWPDGSDVYAKPVAIKGWGKTNMAYGEDGRIYLMLDGKGYVAKKDRPKPAQ